MPEPDLPPLMLNTAMLSGRSLKDYISINMPQQPKIEVRRLMVQYHIPERLAVTITDNQHIVTFFESIIHVSKHKLIKMKEKNDVRSLNYNYVSTSPFQLVEVTVAKCISNELYPTLKEYFLRKIISNDIYPSCSNRKLPTIILSKTDIKNYRKMNLCDSILSQFPILISAKLGELMALILNETVSSTKGNKILEIILKEYQLVNPSKIIESFGWIIIKNPIELADLCWNIVLSPSDSLLVNRYRKDGTTIIKIIDHFIGKLINFSNGNAHPRLLKNVLNRVLETF